MLNIITHFCNLNDAIELLIMSQVSFNNTLPTIAGLASFPTSMNKASDATHMY